MIVCIMPLSIVLKFEKVASLPRSLWQGSNYADHQTQPSYTRSLWQGRIMSSQTQLSYARSLWQGRIMLVIKLNLDIMPLYVVLKFDSNQTLLKILNSRSLLQGQTMLTIKVKQC